MGVVVGVNWLTLCHECRKEVFLARYCFSSTLRSIFPYCKISGSIMPMTTLLWLLCHPQALDLQLQSFWSATSAWFVSGATFVDWNNNNFKIITFIETRLQNTIGNLNASKTKTMIVFRSRTMHPQSSTLTIGWTVREKSDNLWYIGSYIKFWFKDDICEAYSIGFESSFSKTIILRKSWLVFHYSSLHGRFFRGHVMPVLECCCALWCTASDTHFKLLECGVWGTCFLTWGVIECDVALRRSMAVLCMLYKIRCYPMHHLYPALIVLYVPVRVTRGALVVNR